MRIDKRRKCDGIKRQHSLVSPPQVDAAVCLLSNRQPHRHLRQANDKDENQIIYDWDLRCKGHRVLHLDQDGATRTYMQARGSECASIGS